MSQRGVGAGGTWEEDGKGDGIPELQLHVLQGRFHGLQDRGSCSTSGGGGGKDMDCALWNRLPEDILERVLLRLPPAARHRFRSVCRRWRTLLSSSAFLHESTLLGRCCVPPDLICAFEYDHFHRLPHPPRSAGTRRRLTVAAAERSPPFPDPEGKCHDDEACCDLLCTSHGDGHGQEQQQEEENQLRDDKKQHQHQQPPKRRVWNLDLSFVPAELLRCRGVKPQGNGLLLCLSEGLPGSRFVINPMTRTWRELPPLPLAFRERIWAEEVRCRCCSHSSSCSSDDSSGSFTVVVIKGTGSDSWCICVYSSLSHKWRVALGQPHHGHRYFQYWPRFFIGNLIYSHDRLLGDLLIHSLDDGRLIKTVSVGFPPIPHMERACYELPVRYLRVIFMEYRGAVYGGFLFRSGLHHFGGISELDRGRMVWLDSLLLPDSLNDEVRELASRTAAPAGYKSAEWTAFCCGTISLVGDYICFKLHSEKFHAAASLQHVVAFHIPTRTWRTLFPRAFAGVAKQYWLFEPRSLNVVL